MLSVQLALSITQFSALKQGYMLPALSLGLSESSETIMTYSPKEMPMDQQNPDNPSLRLSS